MTTRTSLLALLALPFTLHAQVTHIVQSGGSTLQDPAPYYSPAELTIHVGDIVRWSNVSGTHNVNGNAAFHPENPEEFYSGEPDHGAWTYAFTFTLPGTYHYSCDSKGHATTQQGTIIVETTEGIDDASRQNAIVVFPSPVADILNTDVGGRTIARAEVLGIDGRLLATPAMNGKQVLQLDVADLQPGNYLIRMVETNGTSSTVRFTKK